MEEGKPGIVGDELDFSLLVATEHKNVLPDARSGSSCDVGQFKAMAMQMDGMNIVAGVVPADAVTPAFFEME